MPIAAYRDRETGEYPLNLTQVRNRSPVLFGEVVDSDILKAAGVDPVEATQPPEFDNRQKILTEGEPEEVDGKFRQTWTLTGVDPAMLPAAVDAEKTRRIESGFPFMGKLIGSRAEDRENIAGAKSAAQDAKLLGAEPGDYGWQRKIDPIAGAPMFAWITDDNTLLPLDADDMIAMGYAAMMHKQRMIFDARAIKDRLAAGENVGDVTRDELWPV